MFRHRTHAFSLLLCAFAIFASPLRAQDGDPADPPADAGGEAGAPDEVEQKPQPPARVIYVPFKDLKDVYDRPDAMIMMPRQEYLDLVKTARRAQQTAVDNPLSAVITKAEYQAAVEKDQAKVTAKYTVQVLSKSWAKIPLRFGEAAVGKVSNANGDAFLQGTANGEYMLVLSKPGEHVVTLELTSRIRTSPEGRSFELDCPTVGITTFELLVPEADQTIELTPRLVALPVKAGEAETRVKAHLGSTNRIAARWNPKASLKPQMELLTRVHNATRVSVADGLVHTNSHLDYSILRGELTKARIAVPLGDRILDVETPGAKIRGWSQKNTPTHQEITVELLAPAEQSLSVTVITERPAGKAGELHPAGVDQDGKYRGVHALGVNDENGQLSIAHGSELQLSVEQKDPNVTRINASDVDPRLRNAAAFFKFYNTKFDLKVLVKPIEPRVKVEQFTKIIFEDDRLKTDSTLRYTVERAGIFQLNVKLPKGLELDNVRVDSMTEYNFDDSTRELKISLAQKRTGLISLTVTGLQPFDDKQGEVSLNVPILEPVGADQEEGTVTIFAPPSLDVITDKAKVKSATPSNPSSQQIGEAKVVSQWFFNRRPVEIPVQTIRKKTRLSAEVATTVNVEQEAVVARSSVTYNIENAGIDTFRFAVPTSIADIIQIDASHEIKQQVKSETSFNGWTDYTVVLQRDVLGRVRFSVQYDLTPKADGETSSLSVIQPLRVLSPFTDANDANAVHLSQVTGELAVTKDQALSLTPTARFDGVEPIDVRELKLLSEPNASLAFRYFPSSDWQDNSLAWLGIKTDDADGGSKITAISSGSPAEAAGLKVDDVIIKLGEKAVASTSLLESELVTHTAKREAAAASRVSLVAKRGDEEVTVDVSLRDSFRVGLKAEKHEVQEVVKTVVSRALVEVVLGSDPMATYLCRYRITSSERQRLRIDLPGGSEVHSPQVDGKTASLEKSDSEAEEGYNTYYVNVSRSGDSNDSFMLSLQLRLKLTGKPFGDWLGEERIWLPVLGGAGDSAVPVQQLRTVFWIPDDYALVGDAGSFELESARSLWSLARGDVSTVKEHALDNWMDGPGGSGGAASFPRSGSAFEYSRLGMSRTITVSWWNRTTTTWVLSATAFLVAFVLRRTSFENRMSMLLVFAFAAVLAALRDLDVVNQGVAAASYGILAGVAWWLIGGVFGLASSSGEPALELITASGWPSNSPGGVVAVIPPPGIFEILNINAPKKDD